MAEEDETQSEDQQSTQSSAGGLNAQEAYKMGKVAIQAAGGNYVGAAKDFIKGGGGKYLLYGCGCLVLLVGGIIGLIVLAFIQSGEPSDFTGYTTRQSVVYGTGITAENREEVAKKIDEYIDHKTASKSPLIGLGADFLDSGDGNLMKQQHGDEYIAGTNIGLMMAIAYVESSYGVSESLVYSDTVKTARAQATSLIDTAFAEEEETTELESDPPDDVDVDPCEGSCQVTKNAFAARDVDGQLISYPSWEAGVLAQGKYIFDNYILQGEGGTVEDIAKLREESESWVSVVVAEMNLIFIEIPELIVQGIGGSGECFTAGEGSQNSAGYYQVPNNYWYIFNGNTPASERYGTTTLVRLILSFTKTWYDTTGAKIRVGDLNATGHKSHNTGIDVDIFGYPAPSMNMGEAGIPRGGTSANYSKEATLRLAQTITSICGDRVQYIAHDDDSIQLSFNSWAQDNGFRARWVKWSGSSGHAHDNHFHVRIF